MSHHAHADHANHTHGGHAHGSHAHGSHAHGDASSLAGPNAAWLALTHQVAMDEDAALRGLETADDDTTTIDPRLEHASEPPGASLWRAVIYGNHEQVHAWLAAREQPTIATAAGAHQALDDRDALGLTALHYAIRRPHIEIARALVAAGASLAVQATNEYGDTALTLAVASGSLAMLHWVIEQGVDLNEPAGCGERALHLAVQTDRLLAVLYLLAAGAFVDARSATDHTPLHRAVFEGHAAMVETLLRAGAAIDATDAEGMTPLHWAAAQGAVDVLRKLLAAHTACGTLASALARRCVEGRTPRQWAADAGRVAAVAAIDAVDPSPLAGHGASGPLAHVCALVRGQVSARKLLVTQRTGAVVFFTLPFGLLGVPFVLLCYVHWLYAVIVSAFVSVGLSKSAMSLLAALDAALGAPERVLSAEEQAHGHSHGGAGDGSAGSPRYRELFQVGVFAFSGVVSFAAFARYIAPVAWTAAPADLIAFLVLAATALGLYVSLFGSDPGRVPKSLPSELLCVVALIRDGRAPSNFCPTCLSTRPLRSKHCRFCGVCVARYDHHCMWLGGCIGERNYGRFYAFLVTFVVAEAWFAALVRACVPLMPEMPPAGFFEFVAVVHARYTLLSLVVVWNALVTLWVGYMAMEHTVNVLVNKTTNEQINGQRYEYLRDERGKPTNPFSQGWLHNATDMLCPGTHTPLAGVVALDDDASLA